MKFNFAYVITFALTIAITSGFSTSLQSGTESPTELQNSSTVDHLRENLFRLMDEENPSLSEIENLIGQGVDINSVNEEGLTPLLYIARKSNVTGNVIDVLQLLLGHGANVTSKNKNGWTALHFACRYYQKENLIQIVRLFIENGIDIKGKKNDGWTALHLLCRFYHKDNLMEIIRLFIENGIDVNGKTNIEELTAFHILCRFYQKEDLIEIIRFLIQNKADINVKDNYGWTALHQVCRFYGKENLIEIIRFFFQNKVDTNVKDKDGWTALILLCKNYQKVNLIEIIRLFIENGIDVKGKTNDGFTALHQVCKFYQHENLIEIIRLFIENGIDVNGRTNNEGWTAFHILCVSYQKANLIEIVRLFIENGIDVKGKTNDGWTFLHCVCRYYVHENLIEIIRLFIENGIDVKGKTNDGFTALHQVCRNYQHENLIEIIQFLIQNGIDVREKTNEGRTALHHVCRYYQNQNLIDIIRIFIENGIDVNGKTNDGWTAFNILCIYYQNENLYEIIKLFIENKVDTNVKDKGGWTSIHLLCQYYRKENLIEIIRLFIDNGIDVKVKTNDGSTALHQVCRFYEKQNIIEIIKLLTIDDPTDLPLVCQKYRHETSNETEINRRTDELRDTTVTAVSVVLAIFFLVSLVVSIYLFKKQQTLAAAEKYLKGNLKSANRDLSVEEQTERLPYDKRWEFPRDRLTLGKQLGAGCFGVVVKAKAVGLKGSEEICKTVAVKMPKAQTNAAALQDLISELKVLIYLGSHLNVLNLLGACTKRIHKGEMLIIVEYCPFGNLQRYLIKNMKDFINQVDEFGNLKVESTITQEETESNSNTAIQHETDAITISGVPKDSDGYLVPFSSVEELIQGESTPERTDKSAPISTKDLVSWSFQIARGMSYLSSKKVLHGDLAARNVLLADNGVVKVSDFGMARKLYSEINYKKRDQGLMPIKWMALESLTDRILSTESDVWSYGILLWELFSLGKVPYPDIETKELIQTLENGYRMEKPQFAPNFIGEIMMDCWKKEPNERPSFSQLEGIVNSNMESSVSSFYCNLNAPYEKFNQGKTDAPKTERFGLAKLLIDNPKIAKSPLKSANLEGRCTQSSTNLQFSLHGEEISC